MPSVTVLMSVYNSERYLRTAIESILAQTYPDFEFVIINDGSSDSSRQIITSYSDPRIRLVDNDGNLGLIAALNRGLAMAKGDLIARQDSDDISHPRRLAQQVDFMSNHPEVALLGTNGRVIDHLGNYLGRLDRSQEHASIRWYNLFDNSFIHTSVMFRREVICNESKGYGAFPYCEDHDLWSRVTLTHLVANLPMRLVDYRAHTDSVIGSFTGARMEASNCGNRRIIERNLNAVFGGQAFSPEEVELISKYHPGVDEASLGAFLKLFRRLLRRYQTLFPEATSSLDFRRTIARQYDDVAYKVLPSKRSLALRVYLEGIRNDPRLLFSYPWPRVLALTVFGKSGRTNFRRLRGYKWLFSDSWKRLTGKSLGLHIES